MKNWVIGGLVAACAGIGIYLVTKTDAPAPMSAPQPEAPRVATTAPTIPNAAVLTEVVEVANLDPLLDPPAKLPTGVPFDAEPVTVPVTATPVPAMIPPAID
jgi:hypothetical protein